MVESEPIDRIVLVERIRMVVALVDGIVVELAHNAHVRLVELLSFYSIVAVRQQHTVAVEYVVVELKSILLWPVLFALRHSNRKVHI